VTDPSDDPDCIFCAIARRRAPARIVSEAERTVAFLDISPLTPGHALVIPKTHTVDLLTCPADDLAAVAISAQRLAAVMLPAMGADGVNLLHSTGAAAWQTVFHFHVHVLPRYAGDGLPLPFRRVPGDPAELDRYAERLRAAFDGLGRPRR
jgi:histidine triad (HIT) family protein